MAETSFSSRHRGASVVVTNNLTIVHTFDLTPPDVEVSEPDGLPAAIRIVKHGAMDWSPQDGTTMIYLDWSTARVVAEVVTRRLEQIDMEGHPAGLRVVDDYNDRCIIPDERQYPNHPVVL